MDRDESQTRQRAIKDFSPALRKGNACLFLGAGVAAASRLPTWEKLELSMYFSILDDTSAGERVVRQVPLRDVRMDVF